MMSEENEKIRQQMQIVCIDDLVPQNHLLRVIDKAIDWSFIYDLVRDKYSSGTPIKELKTGFFFFYTEAAIRNIVTYKTYNNI